MNDQASGVPALLCRPPRGRSALGSSIVTALSTDKLTKFYRSQVALDEVSIEVDDGELVGLLGPNGAGKSTLVKILCGLVRATEGTAHVCGSPAGSESARSKVGYLAELFRFPAWLAADEVLSLHQELTGSSGGAPERAELLELVGLHHAGLKRVSMMSKGMQQRLGIAQALVGEPRLLLLDEPTSALDPAGRRAVRAILEEVRRRGIAVLLNSHLLGEVELVCDRAFILVEGKIVAQGTPAEMAAARGVDIETDSGFASFPEATRDDVPALVRKLVSEGRDVYDVRVSKPTLEDVYIEIVAGEEPR